MQDPRPYDSEALEWLDFLLAPCALLCFAGMLFSIPAVITFFSDKSSVPTPWIVWPPLITLLLFIFTIVVWRATDKRSRSNDKSMKDAGLDPSKTWLFLKIAPPPHILDQYKAAMESGLFNKIMVVGPAQAFTSARPEGDPVIYGEAGGRPVLIAQVDLPSGETLHYPNPSRERE